MNTLKIGTELVNNEWKAFHVINDIRYKSDGTPLYRASPYMVYYTKEEVLSAFTVVYKDRPARGVLYCALEYLRGLFSRAKG